MQHSLKIIATIDDCSLCYERTGPPLPEEDCIQAALPKTLKLACITDELRGLLSAEEVMWDSATVNVTSHDDENGVVYDSTMTARVPITRALTDVELEEFLCDLDGVFPSPFCVDDDAFYHDDCSFIHTLGSEQLVVQRVTDLDASGREHHLVSIHWESQGSRIEVCEGTWNSTPGRGESLEDYMPKDVDIPDFDGVLDTKNLKCDVEVDQDWDDDGLTYTATIEFTIPASRVLSKDELRQVKEGADNLYGEMVVFLPDMEDMSDGGGSVTLEFDDEEVYVDDEDENEWEDEDQDENDDDEEVDVKQEP